MPRYRCLGIFCIMMPPANALRWQHSINPQRRVLLEGNRLPNPKISIMNPASTKTITLSTGTHVYSEFGSGESTLLLLHGFSFRPGVFPLAEALQTQMRVIIPDLPYTHKNYAEMAHNLPAYVDYLLEFSGALNLKYLSIFGNSLGGGLALMCALAAPQRFEGVIVRSPLWSSKRLPWYLRIQPLTALHTLLSKNRAYALWALDLFYKASARISDENSAAGYLPYQVDEIAPTILSAFLSKLTQVELETRLPQLTTKTLIVWGDRDTLMPTKWGRTLRSLLPNASLIEMPDEYHNITTVDVARLANEIFEFSA